MLNGPEHKDALGIYSSISPLSFRPDGAGIISGWHVGRTRVAVHSRASPGGRKNRLIQFAHGRVIIQRI